MKVAGCKQVGLVALVVLSGSGCTQSVAEPDPTCSTLADCDFGYVCSQGACVPERENAAQGEFRCVVGGDLPISSVTAVVQGTRYSLNGITECFLSSDGTFTVRVLSSLTFGGLTYTFNVILPTTEVDQPGAHTLVSPYSSYQVNSASLMQFVNYDFARVVAYSTAGRLVLDGPVVPGQELSGRMDIDLLPTPVDSFVGAPCPLGMVDCSDDFTAITTVRCDWSPTGDYSPICTASCETDQECAEYGCACFGGKCLKECDSSSDCVAPLRCTPMNARWACWGQ